MVDMGRADDHLGRATFPDRQILVPSLFLGQQVSMYGRKLFPGISELVGGAANDARRWHAYWMDR